MKQIDPREIANLSAQILAVIASSPRLVPLTTTDTTGEPALVWDENDELVLIEVVL